jgi:Lecithin retinol acyltransferase
VRRDRKYSQEAQKDASSRTRCEQSTGELRRDHRRLLKAEEPPLGAHLVTPRHCYTHHGIYVGRGNVVHYKSALRQLWRGPVEEVSLGRFARGRAIWLQIHKAPRFDAAEVARRARARIGEDCYRLFTNNCEHFCEWCVQNEERSYQIERLMRLLLWLARVCGGATTKRLPAALGI